MKPLSIDALTKYQFLSRPTFSPEGKSAVFIRKCVDMKENGYHSYLHLLRFSPAEEAPTMLQLTSLGKEDSFIYDDENTLLLPLNRRKEDEPEKHHFKTAFYRLPLDGGEAAPAFDIPYDVATIKQIRKGIYAFSSEIDLNRPLPTEENKDQLDEYDDYHVLEELPYWTDNGGFISRFRTHLYLYDEAENKTTQLTEGLFDLNDFDVLEGRLVFLGRSFEGKRPFACGLYEYDFEEKTIRTLISQEDGRILESFVLSKDQLYVFAQPEGASTYWGTSGLYVYEEKEGKGRLRLIDNELPEIGDAPMSDSTMGYSPAVKVRDGKLYYSALLRTRTGLFVREDAPSHGNADSVPDASKAREAFDPQDIALQGYDIHGDRILFVGMEEGKLQELYLGRLSERDEKTSVPEKDAALSNIQKITSFNETVLVDSYVAAAKYIPFIDSDGIEIDGWLLEPMDMDPEKRYPGILDIHGGPRGAYGTTFFNEMQYWAGQGYYVFFCNPRGSAGRGDAFADIRTKYGTIDYRDLMEFVDHVLSVTSNLDPERLGVTGGSYGGWMTNWILGHTNRFKAAASQRSFSNWLSDFSASEIGYSFDVIEAGALPWEDPKRLWETSPAAYVDHIETPTLFIHSLLDHNCPLSESMQIFAAMRYRGIPARAVLFEGEGHGLSRGGKPKHRIRRIKEITAWMDQYLKK